MIGPVRNKWPSCIAMAVLAIGLSGCLDPFLGEQIEALGPEIEGFEEMKLHRPGQPCLVCHSEGGPGEPTFSFAGTLFFQPDDDGAAPFMVPNYTVQILDSRGLTAQATSNECGNFFIEEEMFVPAFPVRAEILAPSADDASKLISNVSMTTRIGRDGSCASCHVTPTSASSPGAVTVLKVGGTAPKPPASGSCPPPYLKPAAQVGVQ